MIHLMKLISVSCSSVSITVAASIAPQKVVHLNGNDLITKTG